MRIEPRTPELQTVNINWVTELHIIDAKKNKINLPCKSIQEKSSLNVSVLRHLLGNFSTHTVINSNPFWSTYTRIWSTGTFPKSSRTQYTETGVRLSTYIDNSIKQYPKYKHLK